MSEDSATNDDRRLRWLSSDRLGGVGMNRRKSDPAQMVGEPAARAAYLAMPAPRSLRRLHAMMAQDDGDAPSLATLERWSKKHGWGRRTREHDERVATKAAAVVARKQARTVAERAAWLMEQGEMLVERGVQLAHDGDPAALVRAGIEAMKHADQLTGVTPMGSNQLADNDTSPEVIRQREIDRLLSLSAKIRGTNGAAYGANGPTDDHANGADDGADDTKH